MQLLPFVKRLRILQAPPLSINPRFLLKIFNTKNLAHFSALTNVRELGIDDLDLDRFAPQVQLYLGHFAPTLRYLALRTPRGTRQQPLYRVGVINRSSACLTIGAFVTRAVEAELVRWGGVFESSIRAIWRLAISLHGPERCEGRTFSFEYLR